MITPDRRCHAPHPGASPSPALRVNRTLPLFRQAMDVRNTLLLSAARQPPDFDAEIRAAHTRSRPHQPAPARPHTEPARESPQSHVFAGQRVSSHHH